MQPYRELLRLATKSATDNDGYPRWVARNRAVSTAYYALFRAVAELCAKELVGGNRANWDSFKHIYRSLDHGHAKSVFKAIANDANCKDNVRELANKFVDLQEERHKADYDPGRHVSQKEVRIVLTDTERALDLVSQLQPLQRVFVAARLIGRSRR